MRFSLDLRQATRKTPLRHCGNELYRSPSIKKAGLFMELTKLAIETALKAILMAQPDVRNSYKLQRTLDRVGQLSLTRRMCKTVDILVEGGDFPVPVRIFYPNEEDIAQAGRPDSAVIFFHGGGWVTGDVDTYNRVCSVTARNTGCPVASVDYRLAPEHKFPSGPEDCYQAARYLFQNSKEHLGVSPDSIVLMGDSAGGNLAAVVSIMAKHRREFMPKRQILFYPATYWDHTETSPFPSVRENGTDYVLTSQRVSEFMELYMRGPGDLLHPYFSPLLEKNLSGQPCTLIVTAEKDPLRDEGEAYGEKLREAGCPVSIYRMMGALHGFLSLPAVATPVKRSYAMINAFLKNGEIVAEEGVENELKEEYAVEQIR